MTKRSCKLLDGLGVDYDYTDIDNDPAGASWVREQNSDGKDRKPTIQGGAKVLIEPSDGELSKALKAGGYVN
ncbi:MAG: glutaredoxin family protein [Pyrinomonadaceae bacterium]